MMIALAVLTAGAHAALIKQGSFQLKSGVKTSFEVFSHPRFIQFKIRCDEPDMKLLKYQGNIHDVSVWRGDSLEIFIKPSKMEKRLLNLQSRPTVPCTMLLFKN